MKYKIIIKTDLKDRPSDHELSAALILVDYFKSDVIFLRPQIAKTPDIDVGGTKWEIKSPKGDGKKPSSLYSHRFLLIETSPI